MTGDQDELLREAVAKAVAAERERIAAFIEQFDARGDYYQNDAGDSVWASDAEGTLRALADAIRNGNDKSQ